MEKPMTNLTKYLLALLAVALLLPASAFAQQESTTTFIIHKEWNQAGDTDGIQVTGHLSCTGATTTQQDVVFTATTDAILFVYNIINAEGPVDCKTWETVPDNYTADYDAVVCPDGNCGDSDSGGLDHCFFPDVDFDGQYVCEITNTPDPANVTVTKTWVIEGASQGFDGWHKIWGQCDDEVSALWLAGGENNCVSGDCNAWIEVDEASAGSVDYEFTIVRPAYPSSRCTFGDSVRDSVIESDNGCGVITLSAGDDVDCEIVNTVFFEGIPTLSQYGMAILALLMLGVGLVGFRRFV
jgi:hypothetical protein